MVAVGSLRFSVSPFEKSQSSWVNVLNSLPAIARSCGYSFDESRLKALFLSPETLVLLLNLDWPRKRLAGYLCAFPLSYCAICEDERSNHNKFSVGPTACRLPTCGCRAFAPGWKIELGFLAAFRYQVLFDKLARALESTAGKRGIYYLVFELQAGWETKNAERCFRGLVVDYFTHGSRCFFKVRL